MECGANMKQDMPIRLTLTLATQLVKTVFSKNYIVLHIDRADLAGYPGAAVPALVPININEFARGPAKQIICQSLTVARMC